MFDILLKILPLLISLYFYFLPKVLIKKSVVNSIKKIKSNIVGVDNKINAGNSINGITGLMSFLGFFGGTFSYVISLLYSNAFSGLLIFILIIIISSSLFFLSQYTQNALIIKRSIKRIEFCCVLIITILLIINIFI